MPDFYYFSSTPSAIILESLFYRFNLTEGLMLQKQKHILLAEDNDDHLFLFRRVVNTLPVQTNLQTVADGIELCNYLHNPKNKLPDIIFLDINMPRKNGLECLREIRDCSTFNHIPVVVYTTSDEDCDRKNAQNLGASLYLIKDGDYRSLSRILVLFLSDLSDGNIVNLSEQISPSSTYPSSI
jgi:CheY-like chemotaxis protein